jgi:hypothetical protein
MQALDKSPSELVSLALVSSVINANDAADLRWYFRSGGLGVFAQSPTAALMARLEMFGKTARPCERCGGDPVRWNGGSGFEASRPASAPTERQQAYLRLLEIDIPDLLPPAGDRVCRDCEGRGWTLPRFRTHATGKLTAQPMGSSKKGGGGGVEVDATDLARLGRISGRLSGVRGQQGPLPATAALEAYYSPDGGSLGALWHLVPAGKTMLRTNPQRLPPAQFFQNLRATQSEKPNEKRAAQFRAAEEQARELNDASCRLWNKLGARS